MDLLEEDNYVFSNYLPHLYSLSLVRVAFII